VTAYQTGTLTKPENNMLIKSTYLKLIITSLTLSTSIAAVADVTKFKMAVVKNEFGIQNSNILAFNENMSSCTELTQNPKKK
jgi:hypothetical protein